MFTGGSESVGSSVTVATVLPRLSITSRSSGENHLITGNVPGSASGKLRVTFNQPAGRQSGDQCGSVATRTKLGLVLCFNQGEFSIFMNSMN